MAKDIIASPGGKVFIDYLLKHGPASGVVDAYNDWYEKKLPQQMKTYPHKVQGHVIRFGSIQVLSPMTIVNGKQIPKTPIMATLTSSSYMAELRAVVQIFREEDWNYHERTGQPVQPLDQTDGPIVIGHIPCMVKSKLCNLYEESDERLMAMGEDYRDPGGYYIISGVSRLTFLCEMLAVNRFRLGMTPKEGRHCMIIAETIRGTMVTRLFSSRKTDKKTLQTTIVHLKLSDTVVRDTERRQKTANIESMNVFKIIPLYIEYVKYRLGDLGDDFHDYVSNPMNLLEMVLMMVKPERRSAVETFLADSIDDAISGVDAEIELRLKIPPIKNSSEEEWKSRRIHVLDSSILSHLSADRPMTKVYTLATMTAMLAEYETGFRGCTDRDDWINKRLTTSAKNCEQLFRGFLKSFMRNVLSPFADRENKVPKEFNLVNLVHEIGNNCTDIGKNFKTSFKNQYGLHTVNIPNQSPVQMVQRSTFMEFYSMLCRVDVPSLCRRTQSTTVRGIGHNQYGAICIGETTESDSVGIIKSKAVSAQPTIEGEVSGIIKVLRGEVGPIMDDGKRHLTPLYVFEMKTNKDPGHELYNDILLLNGRFMGWCDGPHTRRIMIRARRQIIIDRKTSVVYDSNDGYLYINVDEGRLARPLFVVDDDGHLIMDKPFTRLNDNGEKEVVENKWNESIDTLFRLGAIEYIDLYEQSFCLVATDKNVIESWHVEYNLLMRSMDEAEDDETKASIEKNLASHLRNRYTHMEIHPAALFGVSLSIMPFLSLNEAARITYQSKMGAQALGNPHLGHANLFGNETKVLRQTDRPLIINQLNEVLKLDKAPQGLNMIVAFMALGGNTQEDAFYVKKEAIEAGYMSISHYITVEARIKVNKHKLCRPTPHSGEDESRYRFLTADGLPMINAPLNQGDYVIGRCRVDQNQRNVSVVLKNGEYGLVDSVFVIQNGNDLIVKVKLRRDREHQIGDKITSRYAQKGTTSEIIPARDLPFDEETGETPEIIVNPHAIKRGTAGYIKEPTFGILSLLTGERYNGTVFENHDLTNTYRRLEEYGYRNKGYRWMVDPTTGERTKAMIFSGPMYMQVLRHLGPEKLQIRSEGPMKALTRQPPQDSTYGGRRVGEMEVRAMMSHGASAVLMERMIEMSDKYVAAFCEECGNFAVVRPGGRVMECPLCDKDTKIVKSVIPYVFKLLHQILIGTGSLLLFSYKGDRNDETYDENNYENEEEDNGGAFEPDYADAVQDFD